jgi:hypothetical protein
VLRQTGIVNYGNSDALTRARYRGSVVHSAIELFEANLNGGPPLDEDNLRAEFADINAIGFFEGYKRFRDDWLVAVMASESIVAHPLYFYGGMLDLIATTKDGRVVLWDIKTGDVPWWVFAQTNAYREAFLAMGDSIPRDALWHGAVGLRADGTYSTPQVTQDKREFDVFRQALAVVHYTDRKGELAKGRLAA